MFRERNFISWILVSIFILFLSNHSFGQAVASHSENEINSFSNISDKAEAITSLRSILIQKEGKLIGEKYFRSMQSGNAINIKSASKSIISLLTGIALEEGYIDSVNQPIRPYFKDYFQANPNPVKENITIKDLLTMRAGLETTSMHNYGRWVTSDNWIHYTLERSVEEEPGGDKMVYSTGTSHLLSVIISRASGMSTRAFAEKYLFEPMDIKTGGWDRDPQGYYMGGNNLALKPRDMLKIGQMILGGGRWEGQQIVSGDWLRDSFQTYTRSNYNPYDYGYMWWSKPVGSYQTFFAWGHGGQYIFMIPELDSVVVITSTLYNTDQRRSYKEPIFDLLREEILPFLETR